MNCTDIDNPPLGLSLSVLAALVAAIGLNLLKLAHRTQKRAAGCGGMLLMLGAVGIYYTALTYAGELIVTPILCAVVPINLCLAPLINRERGLLYTSASTIMLITGCLLMIVGWLPTLCIDSTHLDSPHAVVFAAVMGSIMFFFLANILHTFWLKHANKTDEYHASLGLLLFSEAFLAGAMQSMAGVMTRVAKEKPTMLPLVVLIIFFVITQIVLLNMAFSQFDAVSIVPIYIGAWVLCDIMSGGFVFMEFAVLDTYHALIYVLGSFLTVGSMLALAKEKRYVPIPVSMVDEVEMNLRD